MVSSSSSSSLFIAGGIMAVPSRSARLRSCRIVSKSRGLAHITALNRRRCSALAATSHAPDPGIQNTAKIWIYTKWSFTNVQIRSNNVAVIADIYIQSLWTRSAIVPEYIVCYNVTGRAPQYAIDGSNTCLPSSIWRMTPLTGKQFVAKPPDPSSNLIPVAAIFSSYLFRHRLWGAISSGICV